MAINTSFVYLRKITPPPGPAAPDPLGLLRDLVGPYAMRRWTGSGFNMIWRPNFGGASGPKDFFLELNLTSETLEFTAVNGPIPNRGFLQADIELAGITYLQQINDSFDNSGQHIEPGIWVNVPVITGPAEPGTVARMASIPHGTTINAQGRAITAPQPIIKPASITPFTIGNPPGLVHFPEEDLSIASASRTDLSRVPGLTQAQLTDPNQFLTQAIAAQTITSTTVLIISTDSTPAGSVPDAGGGTDNIAFLSGKAPGGPNAVAASVDAIFWIETVQGDGGAPDSLQLQYSQRVLLNFNGLSWPHITVATLTPA
jgi:hypothetical protein